MLRHAGWPSRNVGIILCAVILPFATAVAQQPTEPLPGPADEATAPLLSPQQLDDLVAPVALYPDPLLGQVLAASTYPVEITEAEQWLQQNSTLQGTQLMDAARQQNWDPSVQALVAFPDAVRLLSANIRWTTDLGNAFLAQQSDVMAAVQRMRSRAEANGRLRSTPQQTVTNQSEGDQQAIEIQPANPQVIYVPVYDPQYVWGPPTWGAYPDMWYGDLYGYGFGFSPAIFVGGLFPGWGGWGSWGWGCGWFGRGLVVNGGFFNRFGFRGGHLGGFGGRQHWMHDPGHRWGAPYANRAVASRFGSNRYVGGSFGGTRQFSGSRAAAGWQNFNGAGRNGTIRGGSSGYTRSYGQRGFAGQGAAVPSQGYRGSPYAGRNFSRGLPGASQGYRTSPYAN